MGKTHNAIKNIFCSRVAKLTASGKDKSNKMHKSRYKYQSEETSLHFVICGFLQPKRLEVFRLQTETHLLGYFPRRGKFKVTKGCAVHNPVIMTGSELSEALSPPPAVSVDAELLHSPFCRSSIKQTRGADRWGNCSNRPLTRLLENEEK